MAVHLDLLVKIVCDIDFVLTLTTAVVAGGKGIRGERAMRALCLRFVVFVADFFIVIRFREEFVEEFFSLRKSYSKLESRWSGMIALVELLVAGLRVIP